MVTLYGSDVTRKAPAGDFCVAFGPCRATNPSAVNVLFSVMWRLCTGSVVDIDLDYISNYSSIIWDCIGPPVVSSPYLQHSGLFSISFWWLRQCLMTYVCSSHDDVYMYTSQALNSGIPRDNPNDVIYLCHPVLVVRCLRRIFSFDILTNVSVNLLLDMLGIC